MLKALIWLVAVAAAAYIAFGAILYSFQRKQQYFPSGGITVPAHLVERGVSLVTIETEDGERIAAWHGPSADGRASLLYFPGNGGSIADSDDRFAELLDEGFGFLAISYRGYPGSTGSPSEAGLVLDALAGFDWLTAHGVDAKTIIVYGWSLGSGVAAQLAGLRPVRALVLEAPFLSAEAIARQRFPMFPVGLLMKDRFRTDLALPRIDRPLVVLHGDADRTIPVEHGREIVRRYDGPKVFLEFPGGTHTDLWERGGWCRIREALRSLKLM